MRCRNDTSREIPIVVVRGMNNLPAQWKHIQVDEVVDLPVSREDAYKMGFTVLVGRVKEEKVKEKKVNIDAGSGVKSLLPSP